MENVKHHFECNPEATEVFETSNGFLFESEGMAQAHASTLKDKEVKTHLKASLTEDGEEELLFEVTETDEMPAGEVNVNINELVKDKILNVLSEATLTNAPVLETPVTTEAPALETPVTTEAPAFETPVMQTTIFETPAAEATTEVSEEKEEETEEVETEVEEETTEVKEDVVANPVTKAAAKAAAKAASKAQMYAQ